jgi:hypothetical protein
VKSLFRDAAQTEFIIATIPTQLGIAESRRLLAALRVEDIPCKRIIVNQVCEPGVSVMCQPGVSVMCQPGVSVMCQAGLLHTIYGIQVNGVGKDQGGA